MVYTNMSLQIIRSWIPVLAIRAERTYVARRFVDEAVPYHFIFAFEPLSSDGAWAMCDRAIVRS
jgi:hypothetical protein